jgi:hypothetical protein
MTTPVAGADDRALALMGNQMAEMQRQIELINMGQNQSSLGFSSIENGSLVVYDADGNVRNVIGKQDDGSYVGGASPVALDPPEIPNPPTVTGGFGTLKVASNGSTDPPWPRSFSHLNVYLSSGTGIGDDPITEGVLVGTIIGLVNSVFIIADLLPKPYRVWLTSVGIDTAESQPSVAVTATPTMVVGQDILDGAITELKLADDAVTQAKLAAGSVGTIQIDGEIITTANLVDGSVTGEKIIANAIAVGHLAAESVTAVALAADAVQANNIAADQILARHMAVGSVTAEAILALSIQADKLAANSITAGKIAAGAITADKLQADIVIANATFETGSSGRRVVISGPGNEIRFFPQLNENAYGRIYSYVSDTYPDDVNIELRAIDSDEVNVQPRLVLTPDTIFAGLTDRGDDTVNRGGYYQLEQSLAAFGTRGNGSQEQGIFFAADDGIQMRGFFPNFAPPNGAEALVFIGYTIQNTSSTGYITGANINFSVPRTQPFASFITCSINATADMPSSKALSIRGVLSTSTNVHMESVFGFSTAVAQSPSTKVGISWLVVSYKEILADSVAGQAS